MPSERSGIPTSVWTSRSLMKNVALAGGSTLAFVVFAGLGGDFGLAITGPLFNLC